MLRLRLRSQSDSTSSSRSPNPVLAQRKNPAGQQSTAGGPRGCTDGLPPTPGIASRSLHPVTTRAGRHGRSRAWSKAFGLGTSTTNPPQQPAGHPQRLTSSLHTTRAGRGKTIFQTHTCWREAPSLTPCPELTRFHPGSSSPQLTSHAAEPLTGAGPSSAELSPKEPDLAGTRG